MSLHDLACRHAQPKTQLYKLHDNDGLYLQVMPNGSKYWRYNYQFYGKHKTLAVGTYPLTCLAEAREIVRKAREDIKAGIDPNFAKRQAKSAEKYKHAQTLELVTREWHKHFEDTWELKTAQITLRRFELYIFPLLGHIPVDKITPRMYLDALQKVEKRSPDIAERLLKHSNRIFEYAEFTRGIKNNPTIGVKRHLKKYRRGNHASIDIDRLPELLKSISGNKERLYRQTILAMQFLMLTAVRTNELRKAKWSEINFNTAMWTIPAERMKMKLEHLVPLSKQAIQILLELREMNGTREYIFTGQHSRRKPMSQSTIIQALRRMGYQDVMTGHGFRTLFLGICKEKLRYPHDVPDRQLAHAPKGTNGKAYDRATFLQERKRLMQDYADYVDQIQQQPTERILNNVIYGNKSQSIVYPNAANFGFVGHSGSSSYSQQYQPVNFISSDKSGRNSKTTQEWQVQCMDSNGNSKLH